MIGIVDRYSHIYHFIRECIDFSENITKSVEFINSTINERRVEKIRDDDGKKYAFLKGLIETSIRTKDIDSIDKNLCVNVLKSMKNVEYSMLANESKIKEYYSTFSVNLQEKMRSASIKTEKAFDFFEEFWIILLSHKFFFFWYFICYRNCLENLYELLNELLEKNTLLNSDQSNEKKMFESDDDDGSGGGDDENKQNNQLFTFREIVKNKIEKICKIEDTGENIPFDLDIINSLKTLMGINLQDGFINYFQQDKSLFYMNLPEVVDLIKIVTPSIETDAVFTLELEQLINALGFKFALLTLFDEKSASEDLLNEIRTFRFREEDDEKRCMNNMRIKQFSNFFIKCQRTFNNMKSIPTMNNNIIHKYIFSKIKIIEPPPSLLLSSTTPFSTSSSIRNDPRKEKKNCNSSINREKYIQSIFEIRAKQIKGLAKIFGYSENMETHVFYIIFNNVYRKLSFQTQGDYQINLVKKVSNSTLSKIYGMDEESLAYSTGETIQKKIGVMNKIKNSFKRDIRNNRNLTQRMMEGYKKEDLKSTLEEEKRMRKIIDNIDFEMFPLKMNTFCDVIKYARSDRESIYWEVFQTKLFPQQTIFNTPPHHQRDFLKQNAILEYIGSIINDVSKNGLDFSKQFYIDLTIAKDVKTKLIEFSKVNYPIIVKRMSRYDILFFDMKKVRRKHNKRRQENIEEMDDSSEDDNKFSILKMKKKKKIYKCGDIMTCFAFWIYLCFKFVDVQNYEKQKDKIYNSKDVDLELLADEFLSYKNLGISF